MNGDTTTQPETEQAEVQDSEEPESQQVIPDEYSGWLAMRTNIPRRWKRRWVHLKECQLQYGNSENEHLSKHIDVTGAQVAESNIDKKKNAFRMKPQDKKRPYYFNAETEDSKKQWMQAICYAAVVKDGSHSQACLIQ
ncbi:PH domain-containing protein DDB_G0274775-like [Tubulanus polymorphus]|uniref:PH domain-containing protein DDB_G0274775-like n=1 Tax=Tubulanus polymorphus TaxID=672921 RepID=UPI003DA4EDE8